MTTDAERARLLARMGITVFVPHRTSAPATPAFAGAMHRRAHRGEPAAPASAAAARLPDRDVSRPEAVAAPIPGAAARGRPRDVESAAGSRSAADADAPPAPAAARPPVAALRWPELQAAVAACTACPLHRSRNRTVFGTGARDPDWMVIGEGPGANEDRQGEPFVGRAGRLLDAMLLALGLARGEVFITNTVKCRPPGNRDPEPAEIERCGPFLDRQIDLLSPRVILAAGRVAAQTILATEAPLARLRGREHRYPRGERPVPVVATYHPAYLLRSPLAKRAAWEDLCLARSIAARPR